MKPVLSVHPYSTYTRRVRLQIAEKGLTEDDIEQKFINMGKLENRRKPYTELNPFGRVPALEHGGNVFIESATIMFYLEDLFPQNSLLPEATADRFRLDYHMRLCDEFAGKLTSFYFTKRFLAEDKQPGEAEMKKLTKWGNKFLKNTIELLENGPFLLGDKLTLLDLAYVPFFHFIHLTEIKVPDLFKGWFEQMNERQSVKDTIPSV